MPLARHGMRRPAPPEADALRATPAGVAQDRLAHYPLRHRLASLHSTRMGSMHKGFDIRGHAEFM